MKQPQIEAEVCESNKLTTGGACMLLVDMSTCACSPYSTACWEGARRVKQNFGVPSVGIKHNSTTFSYSLGSAYTLHHIHHALQLLQQQKQSGFVW